MSEVRINRVERINGEVCHEVGGGFYVTGPFTIELELTVDADNYQQAMATVENRLEGRRE